MPVSVTVQCKVITVDKPRIRAAVGHVLSDAGITHGRIGVAVLSDAAIRKLNKQFLNHDYATDALSFALTQAPGRVEGEIAVSAETARREAAGYGWPAEDELLLYVVHGALHLVGLDDSTKKGAALMRKREREVLGHFDLVPPWDTLQKAPRRRAPQSAGRKGRAR